ncbi:hypothetical protein KEM48_013632 [Puccinia striiformis f. sp. tritici PST-130]|nr:hypothetical protein KEM48_013632 [Puccinia striiformis f. sp. tritici PST-130]
MSDSLLLAYWRMKLADRLGQLCQAYTLYGSVRPFGISALIAGIDKDGTSNLFCLEPSGVFWGYRGCAIGKVEL